MAALSPLLRRASFGLLVGLGVGCGGPPPPDVTERLWVSELPTGPRQPISAFVISEVRGRKLGVFLHGSVYRGSHDLFRWSGEDQGTGRLELLQDGAVYEVRTEGCTPDRGFDHCLLLHGDPTGVVRYQSRKRWALRKGDAPPAELAVAVDRLADDDADLRRLLATPEG